MYATTTMNHRPLPEDLEVSTPFGGTMVAVHLRDAYFSMSPDEADQLGRLLINGAGRARIEQAQAEAAKAASEAPVPAQRPSLMDGSPAPDWLVNCKRCGHPESWHSEDDGQCPDDDGPRPDSVAGIVADDSE